MDVRRHRPRARRRRRRLRLLRIATLVLAAVILALGVRAGLRAVHPVAVIVAKATPAPSFTPFASAFVRAGTRWSDADAARVGRLASPILNGDAFPATSAAMLVDARSGRVLYEHHGHTPLTPASTIKLFVAGAALHDLGPEYRFQTQIVTAAPVEGGVVHGDVYLVGGGDPELSGHDLRAAMRALHDEGIVAIDGEIVADGTLYGPDAVNPTWDPRDLEYGWAAPPSAVTIDNGAVQFTIAPDAGGGLASVQIDPPGAAGRIDGHVRTAPSDGDNTLQIDPNPDGSGFTLSGAIPYGAPQKYWRAVAQPTAVAAEVARIAALHSGIAVSGSGATGRAPTGASTVLWSHRSRPLSAIVRRMLFDSDNHIAEQLLRALGAQATGAGTLPAALDAERAYLASIGADEPRLALVDGSGLSPANRVTAAALAHVIRETISGPDAARNAALLPRVGLDGTVRFRALAPDALSRVLGKDGYIEGVSGLAGIVKTAHHGVVVYAFLVTDWERGLDAVWNGEDRILSELSRM